MKNSAAWNFDVFSLGRFRAKSLVELEYFDDSGQVRRAECVDTMRSGSSFRCDVPKAQISFVVEFTGNIVKVPQSSIKENGAGRLKSLVLLPGLFDAMEGSSCEFLLPINEGALCQTSGKEPAEYILPLFQAPVERDFANMGVCGALRPEASLGAFLDGGRFDCSLRLRTCHGPERNYSLDIIFNLRDFADDDILDEELSVHFEYLKSGDYVEMAKAYRRFAVEARGIPTLAEKAERNPVLRYAAKAITMRCRLGAKPMPCAVWEQTPENQPPVRVFMHFRDVSALIEACSNAKVGPIEFQMVGWNYGGHDGAFPQVFPVEPSLGGEPEMRKTVERAKALGYPVSVHDCYTGGFSLADNFKLDNVQRKHRGVIDTSHQWCGGQCYRWCPKQAYEDYAKKNMPEIAKLGIAGTYYVDVISIIHLAKCYHPGHKLDRRGSSEWWKRILGLQQSLFGASYSEGAREWALPEMDHALIVTESFDFKLPYFDRKIPFYQIVYHGRVLYNCSRDDINHFPGETNYLRNISWGGLPAVYYHQAYTPEIPWRDLKFDFARLPQDAAAFKRISDDVARYAHLQFAEIENFAQHGDSLSETVYSDGSSLWCNFSQKESETPSGKAIRPMDFIVEAR